MIEIPKDLLARAISHARREAPFEACGWLAGRNGKVERVHPVENAAEDRRRAFVMEPEAQLRAMREIRSSGLELTGTYHSHPAAPPCPSAEDRRLALYPGSSHLIISLAGSDLEVRCYRITGEGVEPVGIAIC